MADEKQQDERPLGAEAGKREEWRGDETVVQDESHGASAAPTTIPPPD